MKLWFVVPAWRRVEVSRVTFPALARTCDVLCAAGIDANVVVVADDGNLREARRQGFGTVTRGNDSLGRRFNDGFEFAAAEGVDFVVPFGSDDLIDPQLVLAQVRRAAELGKSAAHTVVCCRLSAAVSPDGGEIVSLRIPYPWGDGVRLFPVELLARVGWRPASEERRRAIDGSIRDRLERSGPVRAEYLDLHRWQIVDLKSDGVQVTSYGKLVAAFAEELILSPWQVMTDAGYPAETVDACERLYAHGAVAA